MLLLLDVLHVYPLHYRLLIAPTRFRLFFQAEDGIRDDLVTGVQTCALPICHGQGSELPTPSAGADYTDGEAHLRAALHPAKQAVDLFDRVHFGFADAVNYEPAFNSRFVRRAVRSEERRVGKECRGRWSPEN